MLGTIIVFVLLYSQTVVAVFLQKFVWPASSPERPIERPVPADKGTGGKQEKPQHGQAKVDAMRRIHAEQGQAAKHVDKERACMNWKHNK